MVNKNYISILMHLQIVFLLLIPFSSVSQTNYEDSVKTVINTLEKDSDIVLNYLRIANHFIESDSMKVEQYLKKAKASVGENPHVSLFYNRNEGIIYRSMSNYERALESFLKNTKLSEDIKDTSNLGFAFSDIALTYYYQYNFDKAIEYFEKSGEAYRTCNFMQGVGQAYNNIGIMYEIDNRLPEAINNYQKAIKIYDAEKNYSLLIGTTTNLGLIYIRQDQYKEAAKYYEDNLHYLDSIEETSIKINYYLNIGIAYDGSFQLEKAKSYFQKSLELSRAINDQKRMTTSLTNLASNANLLGKYNKAIEYNLEALKFKESKGDKASIAISQIEIGNSYYYNKDYKRSIEYFHKGLRNAEEVSYKDYIQSAYEGLSEVYSAAGKFELAYEYLTKLTILKDSMLNEKNNKAVSELREQFESEKKEQQIKLQSSEIEKQTLNVQKEKAINEKKTAQRNLILFALVLMVFLAIIILYFLKQKHKANHLLSQQKEEISEKNEELYHQKEEIITQRDNLQDLTENLQQSNEEITAQRDEIEEKKLLIEEIHHEVSQSIDYATRLQKSVLPEGKILKTHISEHFVFFKPKDKVSGDFYWWTHVENKTIVTAADCTGHGVPGAFMSMLGISFLREIVQKEYVTHPGVILRKLRKEVIKALKQKGDYGEQKDGMDMALISINHETNMLQFAGANNPLYIISNRKIEGLQAIEGLSENSSKLFYEIKPDKMPIAIYEKMDKFTTHEIQLEQGDLLYMFSDGYPDQFGGPKGKKFKYKPFKRLLLENVDHTMHEQKEALDLAFKQWKGNQEQIDDVVILGLRI